MRKISLLQTLAFLLLLAVAITLGLTTTALLLGHVQGLGDFRGVALTAAAGCLVFAYVVAANRLYLFVFPLKEGPIDSNSREEFVYHVYLLFYLVVFQPLTRSQVVPVPLMRLIYLALGAQLGRNSYSGGTLLDPPLTVIGDNCIIGHDSVMICHAVEGDSLSLAAIRLGDRVTIGAKAVILPGVTVGDGAVVAVNAVVAKGTQIGPNELWGGIPARRMR